MANTTKDGGWTRREEIKFWAGFLTLVILIAVAKEYYFQYKYRQPKVVKTGPLETAFYPAMPPGITLGMPKDKLRWIMNREPHQVQTLSETLELNFYMIDDVFPVLGTVALGFCFSKNELYNIYIATAAHYSTKTNIDDFEKKFLDYKAYLIDLYGKPTGIYYYDEIADVIYEVLFWEFSNNALLLTPMVTDSENFGSFGTIVGPLSESRRYDPPYYFY